MKLKIFLALILCIPALLFSDVGVVVTQLRYKFAIEYKMGYLLVEWREGYMPSLGDVYEGDFKGRGERIMNCSNMGIETRFWINDYLASEKDRKDYFKDDYDVFDDPVRYLK